MLKTDKEVTDILDGMFYGKDQDNRPGPNYTLRNQLTEDGGLLKTHSQVIENYILDKKIDWNPGTRARGRSFEKRINSYRGKRPIYYNDISNPPVNWEELSDIASAKYRVELVKQGVIVLALSAAMLTGMFYATSKIRDAVGGLNRFISNNTIRMEQILNQ